MNNIIPKKYPFPVLIEGLTNYEATRFNPKEYEDDRVTLQYLKDILTPFEGKKLESASLTKRNIDVVSQIVESIRNPSNELKKKNKKYNDFQCDVLNENGFGDICLRYFPDIEGEEPDEARPKFQHLVYYLEFIVTSKWHSENGSSLRYVYLSNMQNIESSATYILVVFPLTKEDKFEEPIILDPYDLTLHLKLEYNASLEDLTELKRL